jgi:hypothetical protein
VLAGEKAFQQTGNWLPDATVEAFRDYLVGIKGPLTTPVGGGIRSLNVALRQMLDLYVCLRPVQYFKGVPSPVKRPEAVNMVIFRENTEDIYAGIDFEAGKEAAVKTLEFLKANFPKEFKKIRFGSEDIGSRSASASSRCRARHRAPGAQRHRVRHQAQAQVGDARPQGQHHEVHRRRLPRLGLRIGQERVRCGRDRRRAVVQAAKRRASSSRTPSPTSRSSRC